MASRRIPLADNPNAANSPFRGATASKRARPHAIDLVDEVSPPKKKHIIDASFNVTRPATHSSLEDSAANGERPIARPSGTLQRKLVAERELRQGLQQNTKSTERVPDAKVARVAASEKEALQNWRRHYRRVFPHFVFYFESVPSDASLRLGRQTISLGARIEKFFSKDVTHVVTTRPVPALAPGAGSQRVETIDPSILSAADASVRTKTGADALSRRAQTGTTQAAANDILNKARDMGIKIWNLEKFERMMSTLAIPDGVEEEDLQQRKSGATSAVPAKRERDNELSQLLRNERNNAPVDRKPWQEIIPFRGYFLYVHDMDERTKPIMTRDYQKVNKKEDGKWPQFRSVSKGRCPFVEEVRLDSRDVEEKPKPKAAPQPPVKATRLAVQEKKAALEPHNIPKLQARPHSPRRPRAVLQEAVDTGNSMPKPQLPASSTITNEMRKLQHHASGSVGDMPPMLGSTHANYQGLPRKPGGEPLASGMQGNVTSAIRSQMISSTAPSAPGQRVGTTKQQHQMSRRILEKQSGLSNSTLPSSFSVNDVRAALNKDQGYGPRRNTRLRATEQLTRIHEDETLSEDEGTNTAEDAQPVRTAKRRAPVKRDPKPGYCENCRDKYDDFYEHIASKTHRKFATASENFVDLDRLLRALTRR